MMMLVTELRNGMSMKHCEGSRLVMLLKQHEKEMSLEIFCAIVHVAVRD